MFMAELWSQLVDVLKCLALKIFPQQMCAADTPNTLLATVDNFMVCAGHPDNHFIEFADSQKGRFQSVDNKTVAFVDRFFPIKLNGKLYDCKIRSNACELLVHGPKCEACKAYRPTL